MSNKADPGIDYGLGHTNIDYKTGIRYGVISQHSIMPEALDDFEADYGDPSCPECGGPVEDGSVKDYSCGQCLEDYYVDQVYGDEPLAWRLAEEGYNASINANGYIVVVASPFYTHAQFCSPCYPGAGNLDVYCVDGPRTFCLGADFFENEEAPYVVYDVETGKEVRNAGKKADASD